MKSWYSHFIPEVQTDALTDMVRYLELLRAKNVELRLFTFTLDVEIKHLPKISVNSDVEFPFPLILIQF